MGQDQYRSSGGAGVGGSYGPTAGKAHSSCNCGSACNCTKHGGECKCGSGKSANITDSGGPQPISRTTGGAGIEGSYGPTAVTSNSSCKCGSGCDCTKHGGECKCGSHATKSQSSCKCGGGCSCTSNGGECTCGRKENTSPVCYGKDESTTRARDSSSSAGGGDPEIRHSQYFKKMDSMSASPKRSSSDNARSRL